MRQLRRNGWSGFTAAAVALVVAAGCGLTGNDGPEQAAPVVVAGTPAPTPEIDEPIAEEPTSAPTTKAPTSSRKPRPRPAKATPTPDPNNFQLPDCAHREGKPVSKKQAKAALARAAYRQYWRTEAPKLRVPLRLVKAVAWHESGWQSDIVNCDGGKGLMQVMPDTVDHMNQRFGLAYRVDDYRDNAFLGANYLAYLTKEFGNDYFKGSHDLSPGKCRSHSDRCLLNLVISAYNSGEGSVREVVRSKSALPNPAYVDSVRSLMRKCFCDRY
jgi:soluble lytic murein transglycosylase-like protein